MRLVLVDIDGTLLEEGPSSEALFAAHLWARGVLGPAQVLRAVAFVPRWAGHYGRHVLKKNKAYLAGLDAAHVARIAEAFAAEALRPRLRLAMMRRLEWHHRVGDRVALLSGTPEFIAAPLARLVGAEVWQATVCSCSNGRFDARPPEEHPFGIDKVRLAESLCAHTGARLGDSVAYADSRYDAPLLLRVGRPVAVVPDRSLRRLALRRGWEILESTGNTDQDRALRLAADGD